jgi:hypothetical protein
MHCRMVIYSHWTSLERSKIVWCCGEKTEQQNNNNMPDKNDYNFSMGSRIPTFEYYKVIFSFRRINLLVRLCVEASPFKLLIMVLSQCCCGDAKTTYHI